MSKVQFISFLISVNQIFDGQLYKVHGTGNIVHLAHIIDLISIIKQVLLHLDHVLLNATGYVSNILDDFHGVDDLSQGR